MQAVHHESTNTNLLLIPQAEGNVHDMHSYNKVRW